MGIYGMFHVPRSKKALIEFLAPRLTAVTKSSLSKLDKKQLYAIYFRVRSGE